MTKELNKLNIEPRIFTIRGIQVMLDRDIAELFGTETKFVNRAVSRNPDRFPTDFVFQLSNDEWQNLRFQNGTSTSSKGGRRYQPFVFTEQGIAMLSTALKTEKAISASIQIIRTFVELRKSLLFTRGIIQRLEDLEYRQINTEKQIDFILNSLQDKSQNNHGIFFNDQIFDAYVFACELIQRASSSIILNDNKELYHIGASLKDLGKKWFAFSRIDSLLGHLKSKL